MMADYALNEGDRVPDLAVAAWPEGEVNLRELEGSWLVLYFYPKDSTPGCTTESCEFRDALDDFRRLDAEVIGVSRDSLASHQRFAEKQALPFRLLSDTEEILCRAFDVIQMKNMYGKQVRGIERSTFLIGPDGIVRKIWRKVRVKGHVQAVYEALQALRTD